jgi:asparagine synthase (glutamine-hydrolysing)
VDPFHFLEAAWQRSGRRDPVTSASLSDLITYLPCDLMTKVDIASMAHSLEVRAPFLDVNVVEFAAALPVSLKYRRTRGKYLLRKAFSHLLPASIWSRSKMGFGVPLDHWFRHELRDLAHNTLLDPDARCLQYFRRDAIEGLVYEHTQQLFDHASRLWSLMFFELWLRRWLTA